MIVSVIMPAFNEGEWVRKSVLEVLTAYSQTQISGEVIVVDDGSSDDTATQVELLSTEDSRVRLVRLESNGGFGRAVRAGVELARGKSVCLLPADWSYDSRAIAISIAHAEDEDIVCGWRIGRERSVTKSRALASLLVRLNACLYAPRLRIDVGGLNVYNASLFRANLGKSDGYLFVFETIVRMLRRNPSIFPVEIEQIANAGARSGSASWRRALELLRLNARLVPELTGKWGGRDVL